MVLFAKDPLKKDAEAKVIAILQKADDAPFTPDDLQEVHTARVHVLIVDDSMTDYQHVHPMPTATPGQYAFTFTPRTSHGYRLAADIKPVKGEQEFLKATLPGTEACEKPCIDLKPVSSAAVEGIKATLSFDGAVKGGEAAMGTVTLKDDKGADIKDLEPVMGAFAHIVGFYAEKPKDIIHTHPMGDEPKSDSARGGPALEFHLEAPRAGIIKLFVQIRRAGKDIALPFTVEVK